jgi:hypothetical protein
VKSRRRPSKSRPDGEPPVFGAEFWERDFGKADVATLHQHDPTHWSWKPHDPNFLTRHQGLRFAREWSCAAETNYRPSRVRQKVVLVFDIGHSTPALLKYLGRSGLKYFFIDYDELTRRGTVDIRFDESETAVWTLDEAELRLEDVAAVIWTAPWWMLFNATSRPARGGALDEYLLLRRWSQVLRDLRGLIPPHAIWLPSDPLNGSQDWQNRIAELQLARRAGLSVPPTICTNDPVAAAAFLERHGGRALFRDFGIPPESLAPKQVTVEEVRSAARRLRRSPCTFTKYIEKDYEVRAVVVGDRVFAVKIDSQASPLPAARLDWRVHDNANVRWQRMTLPRAVERSMFRLMKSLDLKWGSFDLIRGQDGRFYFLEVNRPGVTFWLLPFVGLDVAREIAGYLKRVF